MRARIWTLAAAFGLVACDNGNQADNTANIQENLTAQAFESNDITAIDAVTGEDANMAADVNFTDLGGNNASASANRQSSDRASAAERPATRPATRPAEREPEPAPATEPTAAVSNNAT
ncbi:MAG TPA: hypothetical protein VJ597_04050 [Sphingomicrobium sp.]|nr:hypothetical protein [Sphingomicrobium sp.]